MEEKLICLLRDLKRLRHEDMPDKSKETLQIGEWCRHVQRNKNQNTEVLNSKLGIRKAI